MDEIHDIDTFSEVRGRIYKRIDNIKRVLPTYSESNTQRNALLIIEEIGDWYIELSINVFLCNSNVSNSCQELQTNLKQDIIRQHPFNSISKKIACLDDLTIYTCWGSIDQVRAKLWIESFKTFTKQLRKDLLHCQVTLSETKLEHLKEKLCAGHKICFIASISLQIAFVRQSFIKSSADPAKSLVATLLETAKDDDKKNNLYFIVVSGKGNHYLDPSFNSELQIDKIKDWTSGDYAKNMQHFLEELYPDVVFDESEPHDQSNVMRARS